jgi:hypothetical protein
MVGWHLQQSIKLRQIKSKKIKAKCFGALKSKGLLRRISQTFLGKIQTKQKSQVLSKLRQHKETRVSRRVAILEQISI